MNIFRSNRQNADTEERRDFVDNHAFKYSSELNFIRSRMASFYLKTSVVALFKYKHI